MSTEIHVVNPVEKALAIPISELKGLQCGIIEAGFRYAGHIIMRTRNKEYIDLIDCTDPKNTFSDCETDYYGNTLVRPVNVKINVEIIF